MTRFIHDQFAKNIEETRIYQDLERQTKLKAAARFLSMGYSISEVAKGVDLSVEEVATLASNPPQ
jgi:predicted transposase YdaD